MKYIVRLWVDIEVNAESPAQAKAITDKAEVHVAPGPVYEIQTSGDMWDSDGNKVKVEPFCNACQQHHPCSCDQMAADRRKRHA